MSRKYFRQVVEKKSIVDILSRWMDGMGISRIESRARRAVVAAQERQGGHGRNKEALWWREFAGKWAGKQTGMQNVQKAGGFL